MIKESHKESCLKSIAFIKKAIESGKYTEVVLYALNDSECIRSEHIKRSNMLNQSIGNLFNTLTILIENNDDELEMLRLVQFRESLTLFMDDHPYV